MRSVQGESQTPKWSLDCKGCTCSLCLLCLCMGQTPREKCVPGAKHCNGLCHKTPRETCGLVREKNIHSACVLLIFQRQFSDLRAPSLVTLNRGCFCGSFQSEGSQELGSCSGHLCCSSFKWLVIVALPANTLVILFNYSTCSALPSTRFAGLFSTCWDPWLLEPFSGSVDRNPILFGKNMA